MDLINREAVPKKKTEREGIRIQTYNKILKLCHNKIKSAASSNNCDNFFFFQIPELVLGIPRYDLDSCCDYLINRLVSNGFQIINMGGHLLFISWNHIVFDKERETDMQEKIDILNGDITHIPYIKQYSNGNESEFKNEFRPIHDIPSTEKYLSN